MSAHFGNFKHHVRSSEYSPFAKGDGVDFIRSVTTSGGGGGHPFILLDIIRLFFTPLIILFYFIFIAFGKPRA